MGEVTVIQAQGWNPSKVFIKTPLLELSVHSDG